MSKQIYNDQPLPFDLSNVPKEDYDGDYIKGVDFCCEGIKRIVNSKWS